MTRLLLFAFLSASLGLAFVIPASNAVMMFIGGIAALLLNRFAKSWSAKFLIVVAAGLVAPIPRRPGLAATHWRS